MAVLTVLVCLRKRGIPDGVLAVSAIVLGIGAAVFFLQGCIALAEARGHNGAIVAAMVLLIYLCGGLGAWLAPALGFAFWGLLLLLPLLVLAGFKDKFKKR